MAGSLTEFYYEVYSVSVHSIIECTLEVGYLITYIFN